MLAGLCPTVFGPRPVFFQPIEGQTLSANGERYIFTYIKYLPGREVDCDHIG